MAPTEKELRVALGALRKDAEVWDNCAEMVDGLRSDVEDCRLEADDFSLLGSALGVSGEYQALQTKMATLLKDGRSVMAHVAWSLRQAADTYEEEERRGVHRMKNVW